MLYSPHPYQTFGTKHLITNPYAGLLMEMGLGKTVVTLTAIDELIYDRMEVNKVLVIAPKRVAEDTWISERNKWEHLQHLTISKILGNPQERIAGMKAKADIYVINRENVVWLIAQLKGKWPYDMLVLDELSSFKSNKAQRFKHLKTVRPKIKRVVGLTGTPAPNGLLDLWPQMYLLDMGERLGKTVGQYREMFFNCHMEGMRPVYNLKTEKDPLIGKDYYAQKIYDKISDICISMRAKDYLTLPQRIDQDIHVTLSPENMDKYLQFEKEQVLALVDREDITAINAAVLTGKLLQFANGAIYDSNKQPIEMHRDKIDALAEDVEAANGEPFLVFYNFIHDKERILKYLKHLKPQLLGGPGDIEKWNNKEIPFLVVHPKSAGHGLNMQYGGHLLGWFGLPWGLEDYQQATARLDRQGQKYPVINRRYITTGTMDEKVVKSLEGKADGQDSLMDAVKALITKWT